MKYMNKTGQVQGIQGFIMAIVGVAVILAVGLIVLSQLQNSSQCASGTWNASASQCWNGSANINTFTSEYNATGTIITKMATVPTWIGILITVALAFIVLGYFYTRQ